MDIKDRKVSIKEKPRTYKINQFGKRVIDNWCRYAQFLEKKKREKLKKNIKISQITEVDELRFEWALEKLRKERKLYNRGNYTCCAKRPVEEEEEEECDCDECLTCRYEAQRLDPNLETKPKRISEMKVETRKSQRTSVKVERKSEIQSLAQDLDKSSLVDRKSMSFRNSKNQNDVIDRKFNVDKSMIEAQNLINNESSRKKSDIDKKPTAQITIKTETGCRKSIMKNGGISKNDILKDKSRCSGKILQPSKSKRSIQSQSRPCSMSKTKSRSKSQSQSRSCSRSKSKTKGVNNDKLNRDRSLNKPRKTCSKLDCKKCNAKLEAKKIEPPKCVEENPKKVLIHYPEVKRKTWIPPHLIPRQKPQRPIVKIPPFKTRPWNPCKVERKPMKSCYGKDVKIEKPKIKYPPLKMRKIPNVIVERPKLKKMSKILYPIPIDSLEKHWHNFKVIRPNLQILYGTISQFSKKFNYRSNGKQSAYIAAVALVNSHHIPMKLWTSDDLDESVNFGDINFRKQIKSSLSISVIRPCEIKSKIYTRRTKTFTDIGFEIREGCLSSSSSSTVDEIMKQLDEILVEFHSAIFTCCGQSFAIWNHGNTFYIFNSMDCDQVGNLLPRNAGRCCLLRSSELKEIVEYIARCYYECKMKYEIFSFKINSRICENKNEDEIMKEDETENSSQEFKSIEIKHNNSSNFLESVFESQPESQFADHFTKDSESSSKVQGYLECDEFLTDSLADKQQAQYISSVAIAMTKILKASSWKIKKMLEIFKIGKKISEEFKTTAITEIQPVLMLKNQKYVVKTRNLIFGHLQTSDKNSLSLIRGLKIFFHENDCGIIKGHDTIAVWRESGRFFMFDPNACDGFKRNSKSPRNSCLSWFDNLEDLYSLYIKNVDKNFRHSIFKIAKVEISNFIEISKDWQNFKAIDHGKWILSGNFSEVSEICDVNNRGHQSTSISVVALAKTRELGVQNWTSEVIDEILSVGDQFHSISIMSLKTNGKLIDNNLKLSELLNELKLDKIIVDLSYEEFVIGGPFTIFRDSLESYFNDEELGLLTTCDLSFAIWKAADVYYLFDSHERDHKGRNLKILDLTSKCAYDGKACVLRFLKIDDLAKHIIANVEISDSSVFTIGRVLATKKINELSCLFNYKKLDEGSAILRSFEDIHEDSDDFKSLSKAKTFSNFIACICFANILNPLHWRSEDINEILRIGHRISCEITDDDLTKTFKVAGVSFNIEMSSVDEGILKKKCFDIQRSELEIVVDIKQIDTISESKITSPRDSSNSYNSSTTGVPLDEPTTLHDCLKKFKENFAFLDSKFLKLAIFKFHGLYFIFDPKSSGLDGKPTRLRLNRIIHDILLAERENIGVKFATEFDAQSQLQNDILYGRLYASAPVYLKPSVLYINSNISSDDTINFDDVPKKGGAYIAWFKSSEQLYDHIIRKIPSRIHHEHFTLKYFHVTKSLDVDDNHLAPWCNFQAISSDHWILRANISQNDTQFCQLNRDNQDIPNCILAITFAQLCQMVEWNSSLIDIMLKLGDRLYRKSISKLYDRTNLKLSLKEIDFPVFIRPFVVHVTDELVKKDFMIKSTDKCPFESMINELIMFNGTGILSSKNYSVAIWKENDSIFMFDSHENGPNGIRNFNGSASVQKFFDHKKLVEIFYKNVKDLEGLNEYQLTRIEILKYHFKENQEECGDKIPDGSNNLLSDYSVYKRGRKFQIISADLKQQFNFENSLEICYAISAICISCALNPECYTREIIDIILNLGNDLVEECGHLNINDFNFNKQLKCQDEINWNFELNNRHFNIQLDIFSRGVITIHPCPSPKFRRAFEEFFEYSSMGILMTQSFYTAIWNEGSKYYIFYARNIDEDGKLSEDSNSFPSLLAFHNINDLYENIFGNLDKSISCQNYELRTCDLKIDNVNECSEKVCESIFEETVPAVSNEITKCQTKTELEPIKIENNQKIMRNIKKSGFIKFDEFEILLGKISRFHESFSSYSHEFNASAISLISIAISQTIKPQCWTSKIIDNIIITGNKFYIDSANVRDQKDVTIDEVINSITFENFEFNFKVKSILKMSNDDLTIKNLSLRLDELLNCFSEGFVRRDRHYWTVFRRDSFFFLFNPQGIEVKEKKTARHRAALFKFLSVERLAKQMIQIIATNNVEIESETEIGTVVCSCRRREKNLQKNHQESKKSSHVLRSLN